MLPVASRWTNGPVWNFTDHRCGNHPERQLSRNATAYSRPKAVIHRLLLDRQQRSVKSHSGLEC